ncbi:threonine synthase [Tessaracoccus sp. SD287]|uniref:threonine synthase n=1 Tax=Tessaracoccus sp. SD287 TaxID=2782008 RepID=UPI001A95E8BE|nr:threonine synthase [Tessaracoccus sp. SD287]
MRYVSTRDLNQTPVSFSDILLAGLAPDGGLYLPEQYPQVDAATLAEWRRVLDEDGYAALGAEILGLYIDDIPAEDLRGICGRAWNGEVFATDQVVRVTKLPESSEANGGIWLAHLSDGPTAAFKDMAMQLLGHLFEYELARRGTTMTILGATSGDTGSAAEQAMLGRAGIDVFMLTPAGRMTPFQQAQMFSIDDPHIHNIAIEGVFDDCQDLVKSVNGDAEFKQRHRLGAVNSINWARLLAQVVYYVAAWLRVTGASGGGDAQQVSFAVPTGNFGNICAGHVARQMGLPIKQLVLATNENDVLDEFFRTGVYRVRSSSETAATSSPSMDISKASNFERFVFDLLGRDVARLRKRFVEQLGNEGEFDLSMTPEFATLRERFGFVSGSSNHADRVMTIRGLHADGILVDPHTADGVTVGRDHQGDEPMIVLETALPVKFADTVLEATGASPEVPERFAGLLEAERHVDDLPNDAGALKAYIAERVPAH